MRTFTQKLALWLMTLLCCVATPQAVMAQDCLVIGEGTEHSSWNLPVANYYHNSYSQQLFLAEELEMGAAQITSIAFQYDNYTSAMTRTISVYMANTDSVNLSSAFVTDGLEEVLSATVFTFDPNDDWSTIELETPFAYDGSSNLVVAVYMNYSSAETSYAGGYRFAQESKTGMSRYVTNDTSSPDQIALVNGAPTATGTSASYRCNTQFCYTTSGGGSSCAQPTALSITEVGARDVSLSWEGGSGTYDVGYKAPGEDGYTYYERNTTATEYTFTDLQPNTNYSFAVKSKCGDEESNPKTKSAKTAIAIPYEVNFDALSSFPSELKRYNGLFVDSTLTATRNSTSSGWSFISSTSGVFESKHMYCTVAYSTTKYWVELPSIYMEGNAVLTFMMALTGSSSSYSDINTTGTDDRFMVLATIDEGATWTILGKWDNAGSENVYNDIPLEGAEFSIDLSAYAGQKVQIAFYTESTAANATNYLHIDDVVIDFGRSCSKPTGLHEVAGRATQHSVQLAWDDEAAASWSVQYKKSGESDWSTVAADSNPFTLDGLDTYTDYDVRVAALCDATDPTSLTRYCKEISVKTAAGVPYHESFNHSSVPADWKRYEGLYSSVIDGGDMTAVSLGWSEGAKNNIFPDSTYHLYLNIFGEARNHWIVSPSIEMQAGYELSFDLALTKSEGGAITAGDQADDMFAVLVYADDEWNIAAQWTNTGAGYVYDEINATAGGQTVKIDLNSYAGKNVQIAFYGESTVANGDNNLHISNLSIDLIPACASALSLSFDDIDVTTATAIWTAQEEGGNWAYGYIANPAANFAPTDADYMDTIALQSFALTELTGNTQYAFFVRHICDDAASDPIVRTFKTFPSPITVPWTETFESMDAETVPEGWDNAASGSTTLNTYPERIWGVYEYGGNKMIRMYNYYVSSGTALINSPRIALPGDQAYILSFDYAHTASCGKFSVKISADGGTSWNELGQYDKTSTGTSNTDPGDFTTAEVNLSAYMGQKVMLQFFANANYGSGAIFVDNVKVQAAPDCLKPTGLEINEIAAESAAALWNDDNDGATWVYACLPDTVDEPAGEDMTPITTNTLQLTDLTEKTNYIFYLRKQCGETFSESISEAFRTSANPILVPWSEDFESMDAETVPEDWDNSASGSTTISSYPERIWGVYEYGGNKMIRMYNYYVSSGTALINTPRLILPAEQAYILSFDYSHTASCGNFNVKISIDGGLNWEDLGSYGKTTTGTSNSDPGQFESAEINLAAYAGNTILLQFFANANYGSGAIFVDNIAVEEAPSCMKPTALVAVDSLITTSSAALDWTAGLNENHWFIRYKKVADEEWILVADSVLAHPFTLAGLESSTAYEAQVAAWCDINDSTAISEFTNSAIFTTLCEAWSIAEKGVYTEGFEAYEGKSYSATDGVIPACWNAAIDGGATVLPHVIISSDTYGYVHEGTKALTFHGKGNCYAAMPEFAEPLNTLRISFWAAWENVSYGTLTLGYITADDQETFHSIASYQGATAHVMEKFVADLDALPAEAARLVFRWYYSGQYSCCIDDIEVMSIPSCLEPNNLAVIDTTITMNSAVLTWTAQGDETEWILQYKKHADEEWISVPATNDTTLLENLESATKYDVRVAAKCDEANVSSFTDAISFVTTCGTYSIAESGAFIEGFENYEGAAYNANGVIPNCWEAVSTGSIAPHVIIPSDTYAYIHSGEKALTFYGNGYCYAALPEFAEPLNTLQISFWAAMESATNGTLKLGYITEANPEVFHEIASYDRTVAKQMAPYETVLSAVPDSAARLVFEWYYSSQWSCCIDDIKVSFIPNCLKPTNLEAVLTKANGSVATLNWKAGKEETAWAVEYSLNADFSDSTYVEVNDSTLALTGLLSDSTYYARVKAVCGENEESEWSNPLSFTPTDAIIVNDSTATNYYVPFYGYYVNYDVKSQFVVPASEMNIIAWDSITQLTFYSSTATAALTGAEFDVYVAPYDTTVISTEMDWNKMTKVVSKKHLSVANKQMVVTFDKPYQYEGGNLLIGFKLATKASSYGTTAYFYGKSGKTGASIGGYASTSTGTVSMSQRNFLPKMRIDHVHGEMPTCFKVKNLAVSNLTTSSAMLSWTPGTEDQTAWQFAYSTVADFDPNTATLIDANSNAYALTGLETETTYYVYVRANCSDAENEDFSVWSELFTFQTASACQTPDDVQASEIGTTSALISWNDYGQTGFNLLYTDGGATVDTIYGVTNPYLLENLAAKTSYMVKVQVACAAEADTWSSQMIFKTAYGTPFEEKFATTSIPADWSLYNGLLSDVLSNPTKLTSASYGWSFGTRNSIFGASHAYANIYGTSSNKWLVTPAIMLTEDVQLTFDLALTKYNAATAVTAGQQDDDKFVVLISTDNGANWTILREWNNSGSEYVYDEITNNANGDQVAISLNDHIGQSVKIAFYGESTVGSTGVGDNDVHVGNVLIDKVPTCLKPTGFSISDVKAHSAQLYWTAGDEGQSAWQIALDTIAGFNPDTLSNLIDVTENPYVLTGLDPEKNYYVYVRANCGATDGVSRWTDRKSFRTTIACPAPSALKAVLTPGDGSVATLSWKAGQDEAAWIVEYSLNSDLSDSIEVLAYDTFVNLSNLTAEATYYARVKADCGELDGESLYSAIISFIPTNKYELTLNDGTSTNGYVPIEGSYVDEGTRSQFIIPEEDLANIEWDSITSLTFYGAFTSSSRTNWDGAEWAVYMMEAPEASMSALVDWTTMTQVKAAGSLALVDGQMVITLDEPYQYQGGHLMIGIYQTTNGNWAGVNWYGVSATGASFGGHASAVSQRNFLPKMKLTYVPGVAPACPNPKKLAISDITDNSALASWKAVEGATWEYAIAEGNAEPAEFSQTEDNFAALTGLRQSTEYTFYLRRACGEDVYSDEIHVSFTTVEHVASIPFNEYFEGENYWKSVADNQANAWMIGNATAQTGENALYVSNNGADYAYDNEATTASFATILINFDQTGDYTIKYYWKAEGDYGDDLYDYMRVVLVPAEAAIIAGNAQLPESAIALDNGGLYGQSDWKYEQKLFNVTAGDYKLVVAWFNDEADGDLPGAIDNISIVSGDAITNIESGAGFENKAIKFIKNDQVYILLNGKVYTITGQRVEMK